jgi:uncharacterized membrane protein YebE (DUF533 family)
MHKLIKLSFLFIILLFLFSTYSQSETDKPTRENINIDSDFFKFKEALTKNQSKSTKKGFQPRDFKFLIPLAILFFAVISGMRSIESAKKKNKLSESKEKPKPKVNFGMSKYLIRRIFLKGLLIIFWLILVVAPLIKESFQTDDDLGLFFSIFFIGILPISYICYRAYKDYKQDQVISKYSTPPQHHKVRFNIEFGCKPTETDRHEPRIVHVQVGSVSDPKLKIGDLICSINKVPVKTIKDFDNERAKLVWGEKVSLEIEREGKIVTKIIKTISFENYKKNTACTGLDWKPHKKMGIEIISTFSGCPDVAAEIIPGDIIIGVNKAKIITEKDWYIERSKFKPGQTVTYKIKRKLKGVISKKIKILNFNEFIVNNENAVRNWLNKPKADLMLKEWEEGDYEGLSDERRQEIVDMDLEEEPEESDYTDDDYSEDEGYDEEKIYVTTTIKKEKVAGKESFVLTLDGLPPDERLETLTDGKKIFLKIYVFDVTDLDSDKYNKILDDIGMTDQYFSNHCHVIKTNEITWSDGNMNLIQSKELEPYGDHPTKLAFPYSVMQLPKVGKRRLSFRTFVCTDKQKFDDAEGRPKDGESINYRPESFKMDDYAEYGFDDYGDYPEILSYTSSEIEVEYKQPGYLDINRRKYNDLTIALGLTLNQLEGKNLKKNFEKIKDEIRYDGDSSAENNVYKSLSLKANYERTLNKKIDLESILKELKKNSRIHERYEMIDLLLNLAITDQTYSAKENEFIDKVAKTLDLHNEKFQEIKKQKTASVKFVDFGDKADESIFGITKDMDKKEKLRVLRKEYSRWNALTNNSDKAIRERAREMRDLAANIRKQYT